MKMADVVAYRIAGISPMKSATEVRNLLQSGSWDALLVFNQFNWGYISSFQAEKKFYRAVEAADFAVTIADCSLLEKEVSEVLTYIASRAILICKGEKPVALHTPSFLTQHLFSAYTAARIRLQAVLDTVEEAVCAVDAGGKIVEWNRQASKLYGIPAENIVGHSGAEFFTNSILAAVLEEQKTLENKVHRPFSGKVMAMNARPFYQADQLAGAISAERDITAIAQLQERIAQNESLPAVDGNGPEWGAAAQNSENSPGETLNLVKETSMIEREIIEKALKSVKYNKARAAKKLGIPRSTLYYKLEQLGITNPNWTK